MYYVYLIESISAQGERYLGMTTDLKERLQDHNAGKSSHTSKFKPWKLTTYIAFTAGEFVQSASAPIPSTAGGVNACQVRPVFRPE